MICRDRACPPYKTLAGGSADTNFYFLSVASAALHLPAGRALLSSTRRFLPTWTQTETLPFTAGGQEIARSR